MKLLDHSIPPLSSKGGGYLGTLTEHLLCAAQEAKGRDYSSNTLMCLGHSCQAVTRVDPITQKDRVYGSGDLLKFQEDSAGVYEVYIWSL